MTEGLDSILMVLMNGKPGRIDEYNDWYNNVHIRDCMRMPGAIAVQRFKLTPRQALQNGTPANPHHKHLSLYEWADTRNVPHHGEEAFTEKGVISSAGDNTDVLDYYFNPVVLSNGYAPGSGFRGLNQQVIFVKVTPKPGQESRLEGWFEDHLVDTMSLPGFVAGGLFRIAEAQMVALPSPFPYVAVYSVSDMDAAVDAWDARHKKGGSTDLASVAEIEVACFTQQIPRLLAKEVLDPPLDQAREEIRARRVVKRYSFADATRNGLAGYVFTNTDAKD